MDAKRWCLTIAPSPLRLRLLWLRLLWSPLRLRLLCVPGLCGLRPALGVDLPIAVTAVLLLFPPALALLGQGRGRGVGPFALAGLGPCGLGRPRLVDHVAMPEELLLQVELDGRVGRREVFRGSSGGGGGCGAGAVPGVGDAGQLPLARVIVPLRDLFDLGQALRRDERVDHLSKCPSMGPGGSGTAWDYKHQSASDTRGHQLKRITRRWCRA